jgi:hypothetical protein
MDERYGYVKSKAELFWEATAIEPEIHLRVGFVGRRRAERLWVGSRVWSTTSAAPREH